MTAPFVVPQRILMTADTVGGIWTYAMELAGALAAFGIEITLATMGGLLNDEQRREAATHINVEVVESHFKLEWMEDPWNDVAAAGDWLLALEERVRPDIIHLNGFSHAALGWTAPVVLVGHSCVLSWWAAVRGGKAPSEWDQYRQALSKGIDAADLIVAPSEWMMQQLQHHYGPLPNTCVVYNGRQLHAAHSIAKEPIILAAGRIWDEAKNIRLLAQTAPDVSWPVVIAGYTRHPQGVSVEWPSVRFLGRLSPEKLAPWFSRASIYAFPARYEPFGLSVLEAALSNCALVLGDVPSLREIWGEAALYVSPNSSADLREAIRTLIAHPQHLNELAAAAHRRALEFTPERMVEGYLNAYARVLPTPQELEAEVVCGS